MKTHIRFTCIATIFLAGTTIVKADFPWDDGTYVKKKFEGMVLSLIPKKFQSEVTFRWGGAYENDKGEIAYDMRYSISSRALNELKYNVNRLLGKGKLLVDNRRKLDRAEFNNVPGVTFYAKATIEELELLRKGN